MDAGIAGPMVETVGLRRDEEAGLWVSTVLLAGSFILFLVQLPDVMARTAEFSPWIYVPIGLAFGVAAWKRADSIVWLSVFWGSVFFMVDVFYGVGFFK